MFQRLTQEKSQKNQRSSKLLRNPPNAKHEAPLTTSKRQAINPMIDYMSVPESEWLDIDDILLDMCSELVRK